MANLPWKATILRTDRLKHASFDSKRGRSQAFASSDVLVDPIVCVGLDLWM
jgi:hypothetical protein